FRVFRGDDYWIQVQFHTLEKRRLLQLLPWRCARQCILSSACLTLKRQQCPLCNSDGGEELAKSPPCGRNDVLEDEPILAVATFNVRRVGKARHGRSDGPGARSGSQPSVRGAGYPDQGEDGCRGFGRIDRHRSRRRPRVCSVLLRQACVSGRTAPG